MSTFRTFNERVYPIKESIRFEVDDIESLEQKRLSDPVKIGKCEWRLRVDVTEESGNQKYLDAFLMCMTQLDEGEIVDFKCFLSLINQTKSGGDVFERFSFRLRNCQISDTYGTPKLIEWSKLLSDGFVKDGKIFVVCDIVILFEGIKKRKRLFDQERPNELDLKDIFEAKNPSKPEQFEKEFAVSEISERHICSDPVTVFGLPAVIAIQKRNNFMFVYFGLNYYDKSDWWKIDLSWNMTIVNQTDMTKTYTVYTRHVGYRKTANNIGRPYVPYSKLLDPAFGFAKDGKFRIRIRIQIFEMLGFDENTRRGIDIPMRRMTDAVLKVGDKKLYVCKKILAQQSSWFRNLFQSNPGKLEFDINDVQLDSFLRFLELAENAYLFVWGKDVEDVLELIRTYEAPECYERIDAMLKNLHFKTIEAWELVPKLVDKYPLPKFRNKFLLKLKDEELLKFITYSSSYRNLSADMKEAILERKWIPEESGTESVEPTSYQFSTDFDKESDLTDIKINVNDYSYYASKQILANSSIFFMKRFYGPYSEDTPEVTVFDVSPREFEKLLTHIYHPTRPVTSANIDSLLRLAHHFSVPRLMDECEEYLVISDNIPLVDKLEYAEKFELPYLLESCLKFCDHFDEERPNEMDLEDIFEVKNTSGIEEFEEEFAVSEISEREVFSDAVTVFGLPAKIEIRQEKRTEENHMNVFVCLNHDVIRCRAHVLGEATIVNQSDMEKSFSKCFLPTYKKIDNSWVSYMKWSELVDPANGFVKDGKFKIRISFRILKMWGFDENNRRGFERPMRRMADAVLKVGDSKLHVCKKILAQKSSYFKNLFSSNPEKLEFDIKDVHSDSFIRLLELIKNVDTDICDENADDVLELIRIYKAPECYERIDSILKNQDFKDILKVLEWVDKYPLPKLRNKFLLKLKDEELLKSITHSPRYKNLSADMKVAILKWKVIPEDSRTESVEPTSYEFSTDFDEESDLTDVKINVDGSSYYASKQILANSSHLYLKLLYGPYSEDTTEVTVLNLSPREFEKLLTHIYHPTRPVTSANIDSLLQLAHRFSVPRLMDKCEEYLVISDNIPLIDKLEYAEKYQLPYLLESCLKFAKNPEKMKEVKKHHKFQHLSAKVIAELVKRESE